jgi:dolichol-phosphate mannosyltransferase
MSNAALLVTVGILGEYVGRIFEESKGRPLYIIADAWNFAPRSEAETPARPAEYEHQSAGRDPR